MTVSFRPETVRDNNIKLLLSQLQHSAYSCKELSEKVGLSDVAVNKIIREMQSLRLVKRSADDKTACGGSAGRRHIRYEADGGRGLFVLFETTSLHAAFYVFDFAGKLLARRPIVLSLYVKLEEIQRMVQEAAEVVAGLGEVLCAAVSVQGQINPATKKFYMSDRFRDFVKADISPAEIVSEGLHCETLIDNNVHYMAKGSVIAEDLTDETVVYMFIGEGIAMSIMSHGRLVVGRAGYAGEVGFDRMYGEAKLTEHTSLRALENQCAKLYGVPANVQNLYELYGRDERVRDMVLESARQVGYYVNNINNGIGADCVLLGGDVQTFGDEYLEAVRAVNRQYGLFPATVRYERERNPSIVGMMDEVKRRTINRILAV